MDIVRFHVYVSYVVSICLCIFFNLVSLLQTLENIRKDIGDSPVWLSVDETTDSCGRYMVHVIVGKLSADEAGRGHLILCKEVERTTHATIARTVQEALCKFRQY